MVNEGEKDPNKEEKYEKEEYPLSPADWIVFLGGEMSDRQMGLLMFGTMILAIVLGCLGGVIALMGGGIIESIDSGLLVIGRILLVVLATWSFVSLVREVRHVNQKLRLLEEIREDIICRKLKNYEDILKRCEDVGVFKCKKE